MLLRIIDGEGFFIRDDFEFDKSKEKGLEVEPAQGLYHPKWNGTEWVEGMSQEQIDEIKNQPAPLSELDQLRLETAQSNAELFEMMLIVMGGH